MPKRWVAFGERRLLVTSTASLIKQGRHSFYLTLPTCYRWSVESQQLFDEENSLCISVLLLTHPYSCYTLSFVKLRTSGHQDGLACDEHTRGRPWRVYSGNVTQEERVLVPRSQLVRSSFAAIACRSFECVNTASKVKL